VGAIYRYIFYRIYRWALSAHGERDLPHVTALFLLTLSVFMNLMTLAVVLGLAGLRILDNAEQAKQVGVVVLVGLALANYRYLVHGKHLSNLLEEFENHTAEWGARSGSYVAAYVLGSLGLFFGIGIVVAMAKS
jgi:hypothetical protein